MPDLDADKATDKSASAELSPASSAPITKNKAIDTNTSEAQLPPAYDPVDNTATVEEATHDDLEIAQLPLIVRQTVSLDDDPTLPTITFRYFVLCILSQMSHYRTTQAPYSVFFVQIACHYVGHGLAKVLPAWQVNLPFGYGFNLNPAPWSIKEHVLVTLTAASGATYNLGYTVSLLSKCIQSRADASKSQSLWLNCGTTRGSTLSWLSSSCWPLSGLATPSPRSLVLYSCGSQSMCGLKRSCKPPCSRPSGSRTATARWPNGRCTYSFCVLPV
jgi:hypothetical protein